MTNKEAILKVSGVDKLTDDERVDIAIKLSTADYVIRDILSSLPTKIDWLDPVTEARARKFIK